MCKDITIPSEIRSFFSEKRDKAVFEVFTSLLEKLRLDSRCLGGCKRENCQLTNLQVFQILVLMPFFAIKGVSHYTTSVLNRMFGGKKDVFYSFMQQDNIRWRNIVYRIAAGFISKISVRKDFKRSNLPPVLIADDTDLPKTGVCMECIGKVFSHVHQKCILGYKALCLCWSDGRSQLVLDMSLHGEKGKVEGKEQGLRAEERNRRFERERNADSHIAKRKAEFFKPKGEKLIEMVRMAIRSKVPFEYLLVDSWFTCTGLVDFVSTCHRKFHLLGMAKMGNTKYNSSQWGEATAKGLIGKMVKSKSVKYSRKYRCHYATADATLGKRAVRLFFCRRGRSEGWKVLLTTDLNLDFLKAYEIYAMRWAIEVFFSDAKRNLALADCSARDFSSQIAHVSLVIIRYNMLAFIKRSCDYETIGGLFRNVYDGVHELTVIEKIWGIILEVVAVVAELIGADEDTLMMQVISNDKRLRALKTYAMAA